MGRAAGHCSDMGIRRFACAVGIAGFAGCGGLLAPRAAVGMDASTDDAGALDVYSADSGSIVASDVTAQPDASLAPPDAPPATDGGSIADGSPPADADATDDIDAVAEGGSPACDDACAIGDTQCSPWGGAQSSIGVATCVTGSNGCTVWDSPAACTSGVACCVPCVANPCDAGPPGSCGASCPLGPNGSSCMEDTDCALDACDGLSHTCVPNPCFDHRQDGSESDVDCGGSCEPCGAGKRCFDDFDCQGGLTCTSAHVCA